MIYLYETGETEHLLKREMWMIRGIEGEETLRFKCPFKLLLIFSLCIHVVSHRQCDGEIAFYKTFI